LERLLGGVELLVVELLLPVGLLRQVARDSGGRLLKRRADGGRQPLRAGLGIVGDARLAVAAHRPQRLTLGALDLGRIGTAAALEVEVLANCVVEKTHARKGYSPSGRTLTVASSRATASVPGS